MEKQGQESYPAPGSIDKSTVLNVKPLRALVPMFPSQPSSAPVSGPPGSAPFVCVSPSGPFPPGVAPFYPFVNPPGSHRPFVVPNPSVPYHESTPISAAVPISSFRTPQSKTPARYSGVANGDAGSSRRGPKSRGQSQAESSETADEDMYSDSQGDGSRTRSGKRSKGSQGFASVSSDVETETMIENIITSYNLAEFDSLRRADGDIEAVQYILLIFDWLRRKISQFEESKEPVHGLTRRLDLKSGAVLMNKGIRTNVKKRIGTVPGVEIGDIFFFRMELCVVGLHSPSMAGIDYMAVRITQEEEPLAVSIVSSGGYEDSVDDDDVLIYSGQGGNKSADQKLERGNLALEKSLHRGNEVRVIRGMRDATSPTPTARIYMYDGLYKIEESWVEKGKSGGNVFKYKLVRLPGQPAGSKTWKLVQQWKDGIIPRVGIILPDLTSGAESFPVSLVNDVDDEKGPAYFTYSPNLKYSKPVGSTEPYNGCACKGGCLPGNRNCPCIQKNGYLPYIANGVLVNQKSIIYECGSSCNCPPNCRNRVSQGGLKVRLEVFKTKDKGWGLRSWDPIRAGAFICEYAGEVLSTSKAEELRGEHEDDHLFDSTRAYQPVEGMPSDSNDAPNLPFPLIITAKDTGNVARFMNHSCSPNVFCQPILRGNSNEIDLHIGFYSIRHIPPMTELTYNYGMVPADKSEQSKKKCSCGSPRCKGFFY